MSKADVEAMFGPQWVQDALKNEREYARTGERVVKALRNHLRELDPTLPDIYDGAGWRPFEEKWAP